jgi:electron transport complex protein RnfB
VDAIIGAQRFMHTVLSVACTGCELCLSPCPVDCIEMRPLTGANGALLPISGFALLQVQAPLHRGRYHVHQAREAREEEERQRMLAEKKRQAGTREKSGAMS